nr:hypothetical protein [uncultured bacterium]
MPMRFTFLASSKVLIFIPDPFLVTRISLFVAKGPTHLNWS